jgi:hypothetical protein
MAPEQARGEPVDERADVYAAALLAWRLLTGRAPFGKHQSDEFELLRAMRSPRLKPLASIRPDLPDPLTDAIARALIADRERRTITAAELVEVVREHIDLRPGQSELGALLAKWKPVLERTVKRIAESVGEPPPSAADHVELTMRYEEVALAFDDEPAPDARTFEAHALPSELPLSADDSAQWPPSSDIHRRDSSRTPRKSGWILAVSLVIAVLSMIGVGWLAAR